MRTSVTVQHRKLPSIIIGCLYRHPKSPVETFDYIREVFSLTSLTNKSFYVLGNFIDDVLSTNSDAKKILSRTKLSQVIDKPTRVTSLRATLLDIAVTNKRHTVLYSDVVPCPVADHDLITITVNLRKPKLKPSMIKTIRQLANHSPDYLCDFFFFNVLRQWRKIRSPRRDLMV